MKFKELAIQNFRNFENVKIEISNKNVVFGRNDFGKTNLLEAIRFMFDRKKRLQGFEDSDYYMKETDNEIIITLKIELDDTHINSKILRTEMKGATSFSVGNIVYIQLKGFYEETQQIGNIKLYWGGELDELLEIPQSGNFNLIDKIFETIYIDSYMEPVNLYKKYKGILYKNTNTSDKIEIEEALRKLNKAISDNERVKEIATKLTDYYDDIREEKAKIELVSELEVQGFFNNIIPYISFDESSLVYPTSGDGRKKILAYALLRYIHELKKTENFKIYIHLIEEVENSLHISMQKAMSRNIFHKNIGYDYLFMTTHSPDILFNMDKVRLIRLTIEKDNTTKTFSKFYNVPIQFQNTKKTFNRMLSHALFADRVLLVEGPSEQILFEAVLDKLAESEKMGVNYSKLEGLEILDVKGFGFDKYIEILKPLNIILIIKTDNDLKGIKGDKTKVELLGINRGFKILSIIKGESDTRKVNSYSLREQWDSKDVELKKTYKKEVFKKYEEDIKLWRESNIFLSEIELEEDLAEAIFNTKDSCIGELADKSEDFIKYLQSAKMNNMNEFVNDCAFTEEVCCSIYAHENFKCIKHALGDDNE